MKGWPPLPPCDVVIAAIGAPSPELRGPRQPGALKGQIRMADDFDDWPADLLDSYEG